MEKKLEKVEGIEKLSRKELLYFNIMKSHNVLFIKSQPGTAKSSITRAIADKLGYDYIDLRLSQMDETDLGQYPVIDKREDVNILDFAVPKWAVEANTRPTLIHFEELNRACLQVRNAALQLLNERKIGTYFSFNDDVLMVASGNLGEQDGTEVEELDSAINNRMVHLNHVLTIDEWIEQYAEKNVISIIVSYIKSHPDEFCSNTKEGEAAYATPRSWTNLSNFIKSTFGQTPKLRDIIPTIQEIGHGFVGPSITTFLRYCEDMSTLNINDIIDRWGEVKDQIDSADRGKISELLVNLKELEVEKFTNNQVDNVCKFLNKVKEGYEDGIVGYIIHIVDSNSSEDPNVKKIVRYFRSLSQRIYDWGKDNETAKEEK